MTHTQNKQGAPGGGVAAPHATEGVPMPTRIKEDMMNNTPARPWLDPATAKRLADEDLARLDAEFARWSDDHVRSLGIDLVEYLRDRAADAAQIRTIIGTDEIPLPHFATVHKFTEWTLTERDMDAVRTVTAEYVDSGALNATLEADQHALSGRVDTRVYVEEGGTEDPEELRRWALDLLALAGRWSEIKEGQA